MKKILSAAASAMMMAGAFGGTSVFAANSYNINYTGGEELGTNGNVKIEPALIDSLTPLIKNDGRMSVSATKSSNWIDSYAKIDEVCTKVKYFKAQDSGSLTNKNLGFTMKRDQYKANITFTKVELDNFVDKESNTFVPITLLESTGGLYMVRNYTDSTCETEIANQVFPRRSLPSLVFVQTNIKLYDKSNELFTSDKLYFGLTDIDAGQSYKVLNNTNMLSSENMYAKNAAALQPTDTTLRNMYVPSGHYIYSQFSAESESFNIQRGSDIFVKTSKEAQTNGLDVVFGFSGGAGSGIQYYTKLYKVDYKTDENGEITGIETEDVVSGHTNSGSSENPNDGYEFEHWVADKDITLEDGTTIKAGDPITNEQLGQVVVNQDLVFTAINKKIETGPAVPNTGESTSEINASVIALPLAALCFGALALYLSPRLFHKKISFKK